MTVAVLLGGAAVLLAPLLASGLVAPPVAPRSDEGASATAPTAVGGTRPGSTLPVPAALVPEGLSWRSGPLPVPLELLLPSIGTTASVLGVGITPASVMDAPVGPAGDPVWQEAFWYRGSAVPGAPSTSVIAGHVSDPLGRPGVFARLRDLRPGHLVIVRDTRTGLEVRFSVTATTSYRLEETSEVAVLTAMYGAGPVQGTGPQPSSDGLSHLTLVTCDGTFRNGTHDRRLVVHATRNA